MKDIENRILRLMEELQKRQRNHLVALGGCEMLDSREEDPTKAGSSSGWQPFGRFERWGGVDKVAWFRTKIDIPAAWAHQSLVLHITTGREGEWYPGGPQYIPYVNGALRAGMDLFHEDLRVCESANPGESYEFLFQAFSGVKEFLTEMRLDLYAEEPAVDAIYYDIKTAHEGALLLPDEARERYDILLAVNNALSLLDFRFANDTSEWKQSVEQASRYVQENIYEQFTSDEASIAHCVGHTHLDLAWLWTMEDSRRKGVRTFAGNLERMERYPFYTFMCPQPQLYQFVEEREPELFKQVQKRVAEGRWEAEGAMWVEPDCNIPSGESFVRQLLMGKGYFKDKFGVDNRIVWLPDTFGFSAALPQILKKAGVEYFATTKLSWNETNHFPYSIFQWRGIDGTEILTYFTNQHAAYLGPQAVAGVWHDQAQKEVSRHTIAPFGWGDAGNGATEDMLEAGARMIKGVAGTPKVIMSTMGKFLDAVAKDVASSNRVPSWYGELYLELHRGTLTSIAKVKRYNRKSEILYHDAETLAVLARQLLGRQYPAAQLRQGWELIARNQFHDILPGSSVKEVYDTTFAEFEQATEIGNTVAEDTKQTLHAAIALEQDAIVVTNTLGFAVSDVVALAPGIVPEGYAPTMEGAACPCQPTADGGLCFFAADVPAKGYKAFPLAKAGTLIAPAAPKQNGDGNFTVETPYHRVTVQQDGSFREVFDKAAARPVLAEGARGNVLQAFEDMPYYFNDAWDIADYFEEKMWEVTGNAQCEVIEHGPVRTVLRVQKTFSKSTIQQDIHFYTGVPRIDFVTTVDWKEKFIMLKAAFPVAVHAEQASYDIQFGTLQRPTHRNTSWDAARFEVCGHKWADLSQDDFGVSLLNDCKYGYDIHNNVMRLTLLKSAEYPSVEADRHVHHFTYALYSHGGSVTAGDTIAQGYGLNAPLAAAYEIAHPGTLAPQFSLFSTSERNAVLETIKQAETRNTVIVRLYESCNRNTTATLRCGLQVKNAWECDLLENRTQPLDITPGGIACTLAPFEIKTIEVEFA